MRNHHYRYPKPNLSNHRIRSNHKHNSSSSSSRGRRRAKARSARRSSVSYGYNCSRTASALFPAFISLSATFRTLPSPTRGRWNRNPTSQSDGEGENRRTPKRAKTLCSKTYSYDICTNFAHLFLYFVISIARRHFSKLILAGGHRLIPGERVGIIRGVWFWAIGGLLCCFCIVPGGSWSICRYTHLHRGHQFSASAP